VGGWLGWGMYREVVWVQPTTGSEEGHISQWVLGKCHAILGYNFLTFDVKS